MLVAHAAAALALLSPVPAVAAENHARLERKLNGAMSQASSRSSAYVYDLNDRDRLYARKAKRRRILASNTKLFTTAAALARFGSAGRFTTEVLGDRLPNGDGVVRGDLYLVGGGDPSFGSISFAERAYGGGGATLEGLARAVKRAGVRRVTGNVLGDESLFDSLRGGPDSGYEVSTWVGPLSALSYNRGLARENGSAFQTRPPEFAAKKLAAALKRRGVRIGGEAGVSQAASGAREIAAVESITVGRLIRLTNQISDNFFAEILAKHLDATPTHPGTTAGGSAAAARFARRFGATANLVDGSGLARGNRAAPRAIVRLLRGMYRHRGFEPYYESLARASEPGTLSDRETNLRCRAKTGTISGVSALSGYCRAVSGDLVAFSILMNGVGYDYARARRIQDAMTQIIAKYG
jgi:D-alanyl-D-alanine carboxypeptidase/D-alanyl-D-alanine-endopeptidase (penicillin-binding protein 4)